MVKKWHRLGNIAVVLIFIVAFGMGVQEPAGEQHYTQVSSERVYVVPSGNIIGIRVDSGGAMVVDVPRRPLIGRNQIRIGDVITSVNGTEVRTVSEFEDAVRVSTNERVQVDLQRGDRALQVEILPEVAVRDGQSGVGTLTYYDPATGRFGALGHGVSDRDAGMLVPLDSGVIVQCTVTGLRRGEADEPGELRGAFSVSAGQLGEIDRNDENGIFGNMERRIVQGEAVPVARADEVMEGEAVIISTVRGSGPQEFEIEIQKINERARDNRQLEIQVTDEELIEKTGGIVQGMSGSPILQNGMLVGAVTHVFTDEPLRGYGILAEGMVE